MTKIYLSGPITGYPDYNKQITLKTSDALAMLAVEDKY
jgi:hypothetical protein